jgi:hypothetical protein
MAYAGVQEGIGDHLPYVAMYRQCWDKPEIDFSIGLDLREHGSSGHLQ